LRIQRIFISYSSADVTADNITVMSFLVDV